ncbi:MAG TPA: hypothetical protein VN802_14490 [Stellaceae bacterium]|nr:hypothetical protein [Stellaceae bacterium]
MRNPSPKARSLIEVAIHRVGNSDLERRWREWSDRHPFRRSPGFVNQEREELPRELAHVVLAGTEVITKELIATLQRQDVSREDAISAENELGFIQEVQKEIYQDLLMRA